VVFLIIVALVGAILWQQILIFFLANPFINSLIAIVALTGILLSFRQIMRLFPEIKWVNSMQDGTMARVRQPVLLAPVANLLRDRLGEAVITPSSMRSILDSVGNRLDEAKDTSRYLTGLLVFLGLLGTFYGLLETVTTVGLTIQSLDTSVADTATMFENLKQGLAGPLAGMGTAFSASLLGLSGSLILGFLDLQAGQAQSMFYNDLEDWLSTVTDLDPETLESRGGGATTAEDLRVAIERLSRTIQEGRGNSNEAQAGTSRATTAMANLAEGIQGLVQHMRTEQQVVRSWVETQSEQQREIQAVLESIARALQTPVPGE
jgi:hypothetical protein